LTTGGLVNFFANFWLKDSPNLPQKGLTKFRCFADNRWVNLNEPITFYNEALFCNMGNSLAIRFLAAARDAVILAGAGAPQDVAWRVEEALAAMLVHRAQCRECEAVECLAQAG
jgi:hypothetical protein